MKNMVDSPLQNLHVYPFPTYYKSAADDFKNVYSNICKISIIVGIITVKFEWQKGKLLVLSKFSFCHNVSKLSAADASKCLYRWEKGSILLKKVQQVFFVF